MSTEPTAEPAEPTTAEPAPPRVRLRLDTIERVLVVELFDAPPLPLPTEGYGSATPRTMTATSVRITVRTSAKRALLQADDAWTLVRVTALGTRVYPDDSPLAGPYPYEFTWSTLSAAPVPAWLAHVVQEWLPARTDAERVLGGPRT